MLTSTIDQTNKIMDKMWENWETGLQKVYDSGQQYNKFSLDTLKKQQDMFAVMTTNLTKAEEELKSNLNKFTQSLKENKAINNEEALRLFGNWNDKMEEIIDRTQQLSATPSKAVLSMVEQSHQRLYEMAENTLAEQAKIQTETKEFVSSWMSQVKESQRKWVETIEGQQQTKQTSKKASSK